MRVLKLCQESLLTGRFMLKPVEATPAPPEPPLDDGDDVQDGNFYQRDVIASFMLDLLE